MGFYSLVIAAHVLYIAPNYHQRSSSIYSNTTSLHNAPSTKLAVLDKAAVNTTVSGMTVRPNKTVTAVKMKISTHPSTNPPPTPCY
jgi:hypothetical protein